MTAGWRNYWIQGVTFNVCRCPVGDLLYDAIQAIAIGALDVRLGRIPESLNKPHVCWEKMVQELLFGFTFCVALVSSALLVFTDAMKELQ